MKKLNDIFNEMVSLELKVAELYMQFHHKFEADSTFWWNIALEEENHAALVKALKKIVKSTNMVPEELLQCDIEEIKGSLVSIDNFIKKVKNQEVTREQAFRFAHNLETSASEIHYQNFIDSQSNSKIKQLFDKLNGADKDHAERILNYAKDKKIF